MFYYNQNKTKKKQKQDKSKQQSLTNFYEDFFFNNMENSIAINYNHQQKCVKNITKKYYFLFKKTKQNCMH